MIYGIKRITRYLLGTDIAGRSLAVYPDDTFIVSYPRSGNTWTRFLVANLLYPRETVSFANIERLIPDAEAVSSRYLKRIQGPRIIKTHQYFDHRYPKVLYIVRDPRDVLVSYYHFSRKFRHIADDFPLEKYVHLIVTGALEATNWGTWAENVGTWLAARHGRSTFLLLRYEDMMADTHAELAKVADFFGVGASPEQVQRAIDNSSADRLRELEKKESSEWVATRNRRDDIPFVGTAVAGGWKNKLPPESVAEIESAWGSIMARLGYELVTQRAGHTGSPLVAAAGFGKRQE